MEANAYRLNQHDLEIGEVMKVRREESVFPSLYPCNEFMRDAGILEDFQTLLSNAGLEYFISDEPYQLVKLTMSVVQDFRCSFDSSNPMVHYKIYNKSINLPLNVFCSAIRVPQWGSCMQIRERSKPLLDLYEEIFQGRSLKDENGKIKNIQLPSIRYFAYFITKCVMARKSASKLASHDLAFIAAALKCDRTYNLGALIAHRLAINREKGGICGGLIASRLLAFHGLSHHELDFAFHIERLDLCSMIQHKFVSPGADRHNLPFEISFWKQSRRLTKTDRTIKLPAPSLFNLFGRVSWLLKESEIDAYIAEHDQHVEDSERNVEDNLDQYSSAAGSSYQQPDYDYGPSVSYSSRAPEYYHVMDDPPSWSGRSPWE